MLRSVGITARIVTVETTAYCRCAKCCGKSDGITSAGTLAREGRTVAVSRGTALRGMYYIEGLGWRVGEDYLAPGAAARLDIYFDSHERALEYGRRTVQVLEISDER